MKKSIILDSLDHSFTWSSMEFVWERESRAKEDQLGFGNYETWDSLIRFGDLYIIH